MEKRSSIPSLLCVHANGRVPRKTHCHDHQIESTVSFVCLFVCLFVGVNFATPGEDFVEVVNEPVVVEPGGLFPNVTITIINDRITEFSERLQYFISTEMSRIDIFGDRTGVQLFSIVDDDCKSTLCIVSSPDPTH